MMMMMSGVRPPLNAAVLVTLAGQRLDAAVDAVEAAGQRTQVRGRQTGCIGAQGRRAHATHAVDDVHHKPSRPGNWRTSVIRHTP
jgi:hypothetical protein